MLDRYIEQLSSSDPAQRRQAVVSLGKSGDVRALAPLAGVYKNDPDPTLRDLALKAGRYLKGSTTSVPSVVSATVPTSVIKPTVYVVAPPAKKQKELTYADRQKAKGRLDSAVGLVAQGNNEKARVELVDAIRINPEIANDTLARNLASTVTGVISTAEAIQVLVTEAQASRKSKTAVDKVENDETGNDIIMLAIMLLLLFISAAIFFAVTRYGTYNLQKSVYTQLAKTPSANHARYVQTLQTLHLPSVTPVDLFKGSFIYTFSGLLDAILLYGVGTVLGGTGVLLRFTSRIVRIEAVSYLPGIIFFGAYAFSGFQAGQTADSTLSTFLVLGAVALLLVLGIAIWRTYAVAHNHNVSIFRGCAIMFVAWIASIIVGIVLGGLLGVGLQPS